MKSEELRSGMIIGHTHDNFFIQKRLILHVGPRPELKLINGGKV